ncbi:hypothetical protein MJ579_17320 [Klebsiella pneumoniae]|nr:hypothetical protein MJ579_17320 [Klebsiella pneumoniae]
MKKWLAFTATTTFLTSRCRRVYDHGNPPRSEPYSSLKRVKTLLNDKGYQEVIAYSFVGRSPAADPPGKRR